MAFYDDFGWKPYVPVAARQQQAARRLAQLEKKKGHKASPIVIDGRKIAKTFWGQSWCDNLERYSDFANRLPRGRTYVRNGSVVDLRIAPGVVTALVSGSALYEIEIKVTSVAPTQWQGLCTGCAGAIDSIVELLQGTLSKSVMARMCEPGTGLFPSPKEIALRCSCPDWAAMCKHVAAVLYGIGARLDEQPELLFLLRNVNHNDLVAKAGLDLSRAKKVGAGKRLDSGNLSEIFGIEMASEATSPKPPPKSKPKRAAPKRRPAPANAATGRGADAARPDPVDQPAPRRRRSAVAAAKAKDERSDSLLVQPLCRLARPE